MYQDIAANKRASILLIIIFVVIIAAIGYVISLIYGDGTAAGSLPYLLVAAAISLIWTLVSYFSGDKIALWSVGAKLLDKDNGRHVYNLLENLCITAGAPMPKLYLIDDQSINAFAAGRQPALASVAVTRGAVEKLAPEELRGVLAHELSHIQNYDIRFMTLVAVLVGVIGILADLFWRLGWFGRRRDSKDSSPVILIIGLVMIIVAPLVAELVKLAISRKREYLADASGSLLTRYPEGLASALEKISAENRPLAHATAATAHLYIANPFGRGKFMSLLATHPPIEERVKRLRAMIP